MRRCRVEQRPLVVNNTGERLIDMCGRIRSGHNVFGVGQACSATDVIGNPHLDANGAPTSASTLLIDRGDAARGAGLRLLRLRAQRRTAGHRRDRGRGDAAAPAAAGEAARTGAPALGARHARPAQVVVRVRAANASRVTAAVLRRGRIVARSAHAGSARAGVRLVLNDAAARPRS